MKKQPSSQHGFTLVTLLVFMAVGIGIITAAVFIIIANSVTTNKVEQSMKAYQIAEAGGENALLRLLRNPSYTGETLTVGQGTATTTVTGTNPQTITSEGRLGSFLRKIQIQVTYTNGVQSVTSWQEI